ncbi:Calcineurin-like phosphoesterase [Catalinimonas alkaloidigena]|uniref:Calcineurin-like phosphoesterase n=2 Tax=Catalinimonas alkaloidigena TaxID=1075417 RepID=A0A1G9GDE9_9BACT|nr:Calcineurin-like phosphoesterase [Catalinimonas alkaloidigena]
MPVSPPAEDPARLGFTRRRMTRWFDFRQLTRTGIQTVVSDLFGSYADRRELQACLSDPVTFQCKEAEQEELWIDYVSDLGDGFNPTYALAYLLGHETLTVGGHDTRRGDVLVMGGDQVYPTPQADAYNDRLVGPFRAARSYIPEGKAPKLYAIPGNHDWYDGLGAFLKQFCQQRWIGGWKTEQKRSYFAVKLAHGWWLWGIDIQLSADIDQPQLDYFRWVAREEAHRGDRVILCTSEPAWVYAQYKKSDRPLKNLEYFCRECIEHEAFGLRRVVTLTGDLHHYVSYTNEDQSEWMITAGGGGAFMHPTHHVPKRAVVADAHDKQATRAFTQRQCYPNASQSRGQAWKNLLFPVYNPSFAGLMAVVYLLFAWALRTESQLAILGLMLLVGAGIFAFADTSMKRAGGMQVMGALHGLAQASLMYIAARTISDELVRALEIEGLPLGPWAIALGVGVLGGGLSATLMGLYLLCCTLLLGSHETEAYSSFRGQDFKNFLRLHLTADGLTIYPVGIRRVPRRWTYQAHAAHGAPWYQPAEPLTPDLIEPPIHIPTSLVSKSHLHETISESA